MEAAALSDHAKQKLRDNRVTHFLHFALYTEINIEYRKINRGGNSGTRRATRDLSRIPLDKHPKNPPYPTNKQVRYFDKSRTRQDWRSFRRTNFIASFAWLDDTTGNMTTEPARLVASGQVPPPNFRLSRGDERRIKRIIATLKRKEKQRRA